MITDDFAKAAHAEAERRWPRGQAYGNGIPDHARMSRHIGFENGALWAAEQEPTDAETGHAYAEWMNHSPIRDLDARRLNCTCGERGFTPYGYEHHRLRAALSAARTARRDEETR